MALNVQLAQSQDLRGNSSSPSFRPIANTSVGSSVLGTLFWLTISVGLLISAAFGLAGILGCAEKIITGALR